MDVVTLLVLPGLVGGLAIAIAFLAYNRRFPTRDAAAAASGEPLSTDVINMARIRVSGIGGLGLVATVLAVGIYLPELRWALATGVVFGAVFAVILIVRRQKRGPMPSSGQRMGANTMLSIEAPVEKPAADSQAGDREQREAADRIAVPRPTDPTPVSSIG